MAQSDITILRSRTKAGPGTLRPLGRRYVLRIYRIGQAPKNKEE